MLRSAREPTATIAARLAGMVRPTGVAVCALLACQAQPPEPHVLGARSALSLSGEREVEASANGVYGTQGASATAWNGQQFVAAWWQLASEGGPDKIQVGRFDT